jgi:hypothetical protein
MRRLLVFGLFFSLLPLVWWSIAHFLKRQGTSKFGRHLIGLLAGLSAMAIVFGLVFTYFTVVIMPGQTLAAALSAQPQAAPSTTSTKLASESQITYATAHEVLAAYGANEVAADQKYKGKQVHLIGTTYSVEKDASDNIYVRVQWGSQAQVEDEYSLSTLKAYLASGNEAAAARLVQGKGLIMHCIGDGATGHMPIFRDCSLASRL